MADLPTINLSDIPLEITDDITIIRVPIYRKSTEDFVPTGIPEEPSFRYKTYRIDRNK